MESGKKEKKIQEGGRHERRGEKLTRRDTSLVLHLLIYVILASEKTYCMSFNKQTVLLSILVVFGKFGAFYSTEFFIEGQLCNEHLVFVQHMNLPAG